MVTAHVIDTIEDVIRILREEPEVREAVRRQILTDELLDMPRRLAEMAVVQEAMLATLREHTQLLHEHTISIGGLRGLAAFGAAKDRYRLIAFQMGLNALRLLDPVEVAMMTEAEAASEFTDSELSSFADCDLVIEADSPSEGECYIVVQVSCTIDHGDISRAIRHADMATRLTGRPAYPAVAGMEQAGVTEQRLESGAVHWHRMPRREAQPR